MKRIYIGIDGEKVAPHIEREVMIIGTTPASYLYIEII